MMPRLATALLAESWSVSPGWTEYTFKLRRGVTFHDASQQMAQFTQSAHPPNGLASSFFTHPAAQARRAAPRLQERRRRRLRLDRALASTSPPGAPRC